MTGERLSPSAGAFLVAVFALAFGYVTTGAIENDHFVMLARAFQLLYGDWPVRDFVDPGQPLAYLVSTAAAAVWGPTLLVNVVLCLLFLAATAALTYLLALRSTGSRLAALVAALVVVLFPPRLYNTTKVIVPVVAIALAWRYADRPDARRLLMLAAWTAVAFLMRHDYALYVAAANATVIVSSGAAAPRVALRNLAVYAALSLVFVLPWLVYVQAEQGLGDYFASALRFAAAERRRTVTGWPHSPLFYLCIALPLAGLVVSRQNGPHLARPHLASAAVLVLLLDVAFLRDVLVARLPDVIAPMAVLAAAIAGGFWSPRTMHVASVAVLVVAAPVVVARSVERAGAVPTPAAISRHATDITRRLDQASPGIQPNLSLAPLVAYLSRCTAPDERVLVSGFGPEISVLAHRPFAGGLAAWIPGYYDDPRDVARAIAQLNRERVGAVVMLDGSAEFFTSWPALGQWVQSHHFDEHPANSVNRRTRVWLPDRPALAPVDGATGLPCLSARP